MSLVGLPYELVSYVVQHLDLSDIRNLSFSCKTFQFLVREHNITKLLLEVGSHMHAKSNRAEASLLMVLLF